jgi:ATP synthase protein I
LPRREPDDLRSLGDRLEAARGDKQPQQIGTPNLGGVAIAFRLLSELVAAVFVGFVLGWGLDWAFGTRPVFLLVMLALGLAAGFRNAIHAANELNKKMLNGEKES